MLDWSAPDDKASHNVTIPQTLRERALNALHWYRERPHIPGPVNWSHLVSHGLFLALEELCRRDNHGSDFPERPHGPAPLKPGPGAGAMAASWTRRRRNHRE